MKFDRIAVGLKRFRMMWAAVLALPVAVGFAASAAAWPEFAQTETIDAPPGVTFTVRLDELFDNAGTNPVFIGVGYPVTEYLDTSRTALDGDTRQSFTVTVKTAAELSAMTSPPSSPFTFTAYVGMRNDEGQDESGTVTFRTTYTRTDTSGPGAVEPVFTQTETIDAAPGATLTFSVDDLFDNAGTNPRFTDLQLDSIFLTSSSGFGHIPPFDHFRITVLTSAELSAISRPPPSPFTFEATAWMANDEGQKASGTITFQTTYERTDVSTTPPGETPASIVGAEEGG